MTLPPPKHGSPRPGRRGSLYMGPGDDWTAEIDGHIQRLVTGYHIHFVRTGLYLDGPHWPFYVVERDEAPAVPEYVIEAVRVDADGHITNVPRQRRHRLGLALSLLAGVSMCTLAWLAYAWGWL